MDLSAQLQLPRCPHCGVFRPTLDQLTSHLETRNHNATNPRHWRVYFCRGCGGVVTAAAVATGDPNRAQVIEHYPAVTSIEADLPERAHAFLTQAVEAVRTPAGAVMLAASAVDAMLKAKGYKDGSLYARIGKAAADHLITADMAEWAHEVRLDANDQRHADENAALPIEADARRSVDFARALGLFMFTLPARVRAGRAAAKGEKPA
ncbi:MAG TPA: DUF4145 domain-containing protein [Myxococcota bacterium]|nr:DUF4145 domain-containing protein [Myxococcota bacterium]